MIPRSRLKSGRLRASVLTTTAKPTRKCRGYSAVAAAAVESSAVPFAPPPALSQPHPYEQQAHTIRRYPSTQPPSHKPPAARKTQLLRQYTSLLRSAPLLLFFQHNNLRAVEWAAIRRELAIAIAKVPASNSSTPEGEPESAVTVDPEQRIKLQIIQTRLFEVALRLVEHYDPISSAQLTSTSNDPTTTLSTAALHISRGGKHRNASRPKKTSLSALMSGPLAILAFPSLSPAHLAATLKILAPTAASGAFPAPKRREQAGYYEPVVQQGLAKLMLLGARSEGQAMDGDRVRWVGGIHGGLDGLRAQVVALLQGAGAQLANVLEGHSRSLYLTLEGRKSIMEEETGDNTTKEV